jgi:hypothetical protein
MTPGQAGLLLVWLDRLWPLVPLAMFFLLLRSTLRRRVMFFALGYLICIGLDAVLMQLTVAVPAQVSVDSSLAEQAFHHMVVAHLRSIILAFLASLPLLWWFSRLFVTQSESTPSAQP